VPAWTPSVRLPALLQVLMLPDLTAPTGSAPIGGTRTFAELLIDCEEDRVLRSVLVGKLREAD
jgi:hypothetical protein